jgi:thiol:disulfide interchange protein
MKIGACRWAIIFVFLLSGCSTASSSFKPAKTVYQAHTQVDLISPSKNVQPGEALWVGWRLKMDDHWHVYWKNPGDSGLAPTIRWSLPENFAAGPIQWPYPHLISIPPLTSYGYEKEVILFSLIQVPREFVADNIQIKARADWLACKIECIPGRAELELVLPVAKQSSGKDSLVEKVFRDMQKKWPIKSQQIKVQAYEQGGKILLDIGPSSIIKEGSQLYFYPERADVIDHAAEQVLTAGEDVRVLAIKKSSLQTKPLTSISGILVNQNGWENKSEPQALLVDANISGAVPPAVEMAVSGEGATFGEGGTMTLIVACVFALLGGLILNLMPCVLPVLSLKIIHIVEHAQDRKKSFMNGLVFAAGIIVSFWLLALLLMILRSLGSSIGWGFQFQSPAFVAVIAVVLFVFALNLFGVFEVGSSLTTLGNASVGKSGYAGSFLNGVLATIVATPCTAPFMGTALSFALSRSALDSFLVFTFLGLGLALPVVVLSRFPKLLKAIPKPGLWMNTLKAVLGFILMASVIWLVWVFGLQKGIGAVIALLSAFLFLSIGLYFYGQTQAAIKTSLLKIVSVVIFIITGLICALLAVRSSAVVPIAAEGTMSSENSGIVWQSYSPELFEQLKQGERPVFLDFTAAWCLSCQVNDRVALSDQRVIKGFRDYGIVAVKADWTNNDPAITAALASYGRNSIPLYVLYPGKGKEPVFLPEIITPGIVLDFLQLHLEK